MSIGLVFVAPARRLFNNHSPPGLQVQATQPSGIPLPAASSVGACRAPATLHGCSYFIRTEKLQLLKLVKVYLRIVIASGGQMEFYSRSCDDSHIHILHTTYIGIS